MGSGSEKNEERTQRRTNSVEAFPYRLLGKDIVLSYTSGPGLYDLDDPYEIAKGPTEFREALFFLEEVDPMGIVVRKVMLDKDDKEGIGLPIYFPWGAVHSLFQAYPDEPEGENRAEETGAKGPNSGSQNQE